MQYWNSDVSIIRYDMGTSRSCTYITKHACSNSTCKEAKATSLGRGRGYLWWWVCKDEERVRWDANRLCSPWRYHRHFWFAIHMCTPFCKHNTWFANETVSYKYHLDDSPLQIQPLWWKQMDNKTRRRHLRPWASLWWMMMPYPLASYRRC